MRFLVDRFTFFISATAEVRMPCAAVQLCLDDETHAINARQDAVDLRACLTGGLPAFDDMLCPALAPWLGCYPTS